LIFFTERGEGWEEYQLGDLCGFFNGFAFKSKDAVEQSNVQLIRMGNLYQNKLDLDRKPSFYPEAFGDEYDRYRLYEGDLIISLTGTVDKEDYGYTVSVPKTEKALLLNQRIAKIVDIDDSLVGEDFILFVMRTRSFLDALYKTARGVRQANLSTQTMKELKIGLPAIPQQRILVEKLERLQVEKQCLEIIYQQKLKTLIELKQSILQKAFRGELTADDAPQEAAG
jgi:type I restriction enzyme, S subunit